MLSLKAADTDANMRCVDHIDIVCSVTDRKSSLGWIAVLDELDDFSLLLWTHSASEHDIGPFTEVNEPGLDPPVLLDERQGLTSDNHGVVTDLLRLALLLEVELYL